jgi:hypothetical protein
MDTAAQAIAPEGLTRLQLHHVVQCFGRPHRVIRVNDCCARIIPLTKANDSEDGSNISPNSEIEIIGHWNPASKSVRFNGARVGDPQQSAPVEASLFPDQPQPIEQEQPSLL